ncbi:helix-turn-helix domain-containing protein [Priestia endophytica]|uniref:AlbA family DNA-binding domain-containing protein n=1 Tax=Priestia endophytica TaxID=135735 RepID=UPI00227D9D62|nr:ATP-binding protein [Priestia endophytica]MCY8233685.1 ATP-binding protein [Priestia endophytica]
MLTQQKFFELLEKGREDNGWDYKQDIKLKPKEAFYEMLKDILAFSNSSGGGYLLLGIEDESHELVGVSERLDEADLGNKIQTTLGYSLNVQLFYFEYLTGDEEKKTLGILYIPESERINVAHKNLTGQKGVIVQEGIPYVRRDTKSTAPIGDDYEKLLQKVKAKGEYKFKEYDLKILERNKGYSNHYGIKIREYVRGDFEFTTNEFSSKIQEIYHYQTKYNKLEFGLIVGFEENKIDDYFEGKAFPNLEQILRITKIFDLPSDFFFKKTLNQRSPIWENPMVSYCIINKVKQKRKLFFINKNDFFEDVLWSFCKQFLLFIDWLDSDIPERQKDKNGEEELTNLFSYKKYDFLYESLSEWNEQQIIEYKEHMEVQNYKVLEYLRIDKDDEAKFESGLMREEIVMDNFIQLGDELICRLINECIKEIEINSDEIKVYLHFIEEIRNKEIKGRSYDLNDLSLELVSQK